MEIKYYGHSCFHIRGREGTVVTDPFNPAIGYKPAIVSTDICTISHDHPGHNYTESFRNHPYLITGPGEYEVNGIFVTGTAAFHDANQGANNGKNTIFSFLIEGCVVTHLGDLGHIPDRPTVEELGEIDILLVPVGGETTISSNMASDVINLLEPHVVIPMHFHTSLYSGKTTLAPVANFLKEMGLQHAAAGDSYRVSSTTLPEDTEVVVLGVDLQNDDA